MLNQIKANEFNINEMAVSVSSLLKYVKTIARNGNPGEEDDSPKEENEQSFEDETQNQDVPNTNATEALWTKCRISCQSWLLRRVISPLARAVCIWSTRICLAMCMKSREMLQYHDGHLLFFFRDYMLWLW